MTKNIDFIGDVHGRARLLEKLLERLGYRLKAGAWTHPGRIAVFVGDLVDRGPEQFRTVDIVRRMREAGSALCIMGNHEHSALGWVTPDPATPGEFCRPHRPYNLRMHQEFLMEAAERPALYLELLDWIRTLPIVLEISGIRVAHACWDERQVGAVLAAQRADGALSEKALMDSLVKGGALHKPCEVIMKGPEAKLPQGRGYVDGMGKERNEVRIAWWASSRELRDIALPMPGLDRNQLPEVTLGEEQFPVQSPERLYVVGHYWMEGTPAVLRPNTISVDYSGDPSRPLTAYCWQGEPEFTAKHFVQVR